MTSPYVIRNLDNAQYTQPRGSQYEGPANQSTPTYISPTFYCLDCEMERAYLDAMDLRDEPVTCDLIAGHPYTRKGR